MKRLMTTGLLLVAFATTGMCEANHTHYSEWMVASEMARVAHPYNLDYSPNKARWAYSLSTWPTATSRWPPT